MITDNDRKILLQEYYDRGVLQKEIRSYEISLWTLQDEFITVLKWSDIAQKGTVENAKMTLNVDGTEKLSFSIPMYYRNFSGQLIENPNWYNVTQGLLIKGLRKLKVILNKGTVDEEVFEFVIINITESHSGDVLTCEVEAEGLAFQELGKIGYKLNLSQENFELSYKQWQEKGYWFSYDSFVYNDISQQKIVSELPITDIENNTIYLVFNSGDYDVYTYVDNNWLHAGTAYTSKPLATVQYWCEQACHLKPYNNSFDFANEWYYLIDMNYQSYSSTRHVNKIYEESYAVDWDENLKPTRIVKHQEKARMMSIENSNLYNITQDMAEQFEVFCRYEYVYDNNYHIIGRKIIFYNNFTQEGKDDFDVFSLTYPYSLSEVERTIESADIATKLYVLGVEDSTTLEGQTTISNSPANMSQEDYILNFDYLLEIGAISQEQYDLVLPYLKEMRNYNKELKWRQAQRSSYEIQIPELEGKKTYYKNSLDLDQEQIFQNQQLRNALDSKDGIKDGLIEVTMANCDTLVIQKNESGTFFINFTHTNKGIDVSTLTIYRTRNIDTLSDSILNSDYICNYDEYNNLVSVDFKTKPETEFGRVYLTYKYNPKLYYDNIVQAWQVKQYNDDVEYKKLVIELGPQSSTEEGYDLTPYPSGTDVASAYNQGLYKKLNDIKDIISNLLRAKNVVIEEFNRAMGPAIREGYWQPDDSNIKATGTQQVYSSSITQNSILADTQDSAIIAWDTDLFDKEESVFYKMGIEGSYYYFYPCIDLYSLYGDNIPTDLESYSLVWKSTQYSTDTDYDFDNIKDLTIFSVGSKAIIKMLKFKEPNSNSYNYRPVLVITGAKNFTGQQLYRMVNFDIGEARLEKYSTTIANGIITPNHTDTQDIPNICWICYKSPGTPKPSDWSSDLNSFWDSLTSAGSITNEHFANIDNIYPRIKFSSLLLKTDSTNLAIKYDNVLLKYAEDYYINTRETKHLDNYYYLEYYITIKPEAMIKYGYSLNKEITVYYALSNADTAVYLDALKVSEENAKPKVSYNVTSIVLQVNLMKHLYSKLAHIVMINDTSLKFENEFGYISGLELDLDQPWNDKLEIKNYTDKFEDLFSKIIAASEEMRRNQGALSQALSGGAPLNALGLEKTLSSQDVMLQAYLDAYFDSSEVVKKKLESLFTEAGTILADSNKSLNKVHNLTLKNAQILSSFSQDVAAELSVQTKVSLTRPSEFKPGDIWYQPDPANQNDLSKYNRYVATASSQDIHGNASGYDGYVRTYNGTLASITGANIDINANEGTIAIAADKVVNITGGEVNIISEYKQLQDEYTHGWIHLISTNAAGSNAQENTLSKVLIDPGKMELGSTNILMRGANNITLIASRGESNSTSAIEIDTSKGIYIGAGKGLTLFSGNVSVNNENALTYNDGGGASIELNSEHLILGYANLSSDSSTVIELTDGRLIAAVGQHVDGLRNNNITLTNTVTGLKLTKDFFGIATGSEDQRAVITMSGSTIELGAGKNPKTAGTYVSIGSSGIEMGSLANLYVNMSNFKLQTNTGLGTRFAVGTNLNNICTNGIINNSDPSSITGWIGMVFTNSNLYVAGNIIANSFQTNVANATAFFKANSSGLGFYKNDTNKTALLTIDSSGYVQAANLYISASNLHIGNSSFETVRTGISSEIDSDVTAAKSELNGNINTAKGELNGNINTAKNELIASIGSVNGVVNNIISGAQKVGRITTTGIDIYNNSIDITAAANLTLGANQSLTLFTSQANRDNGTSAFIMDKDGITLATLKSMTFAASGTITMASGGQIELSTTVLGAGRRFLINANQMVFEADITQNNIVNWETLMKLDPTGAIIPKGILGTSWLLTDTNGGGLVSYGPEGSSERTSPTMGWLKNNGTGGVPFWIHMPAGSRNNPHGDSKDAVAFYYQDGIVYIRNLVLYNELKYCTNGGDFAEQSPGYSPSSQTGGETGGSTSGDQGGYTPPPTQEGWKSNNAFSHGWYVNDVHVGPDEPHVGPPGGRCSICGETGIIV